MPIIFYGAIAKDEVIKIYDICHYIILPSKSEGFPKVIGEAMNYGCIPIVTNVSCIGEYIYHNENGVLMEKVSSKNIKTALLQSFAINQNGFDKIINSNYKLASIFTYERYNDRIKKEIFQTRFS